jgi:hypothetical protein
MNREPRVRAEQRRWTRDAASQARDGIPAHAFAREAGGRPGRLAQRDFDLGRGVGLVPAAEGAPPTVTAVLLTSGDGRADWLRAGQALHRLLLHATTKWVFASLHTQPLEVSPVRGLISERLGLPGAAQLLLQFGRCEVTHPTGRRAPEELIEEP